MLFVLRFFFLLLFHWGGLCLAQAFSLNLSSFSSKTKYLVYEDKDLVYIFPEEYKKWIPNLVAKNREWIKTYEREFQWSLDYKTYFLLASPDIYFPNAFASVFPHYRAVFLNGTLGLVNESDMAVNMKESPYSVFIHELAHLFQLSAKASPVSRWSHFLFGNIPSPILYFPNMLTPYLLLEGNATYNESRFYESGRLYSPTYRALFFSLLKDEKVNEERLFNNHLFFPFTTEKYIVGAYFNAFLHLHYKNPNIFFLEHSKHWLNPFLINSTFKKIFDKSDRQLISEFKNFYQKKAQKQKKLQTQSLAKSLKHYGLNRTEAQIFFFTTDFRSMSQLNIYDIKKKILKKKKTHLPGGKLFVFNESREKKFYSRSSQEIKRETLTSGLFDENLNPKIGFQDKYVYDIRQGHVLYSQASSSYFEPLLYKNGHIKGPAFSYPLLDDRGQIFDFKQEGKICHLMRNQEVVFSFKSYFPKLVDVSADGNEIYFIAATESGASLFSLNLNRKKILRLSLSDRIVDAKKMTEKHFFAVEVSGDGYTYHVLEASKPEKIRKNKGNRKTSDDSYALFLTSIHKNFKPNKKSSSKKKQDQKEKEKFSSKTPSSSISSSNFKPYQGLKNLKYVYAKPFIFSSFGKAADLSGSLEVLFLDPLAYHRISVNDYFKWNPHLNYRENLFLLQYDHLKYVLDFSLGYQFLAINKKLGLKNSVSTEGLGQNSFERKEGIHSLFIKGVYPFLSLGRWSFLSGINLSQHFFYEYDYNRRESEKRHEFSLPLTSFSSTLNLKYSKGFAHSFYPHRLFLLKMTPSIIPFYESFPYEFLLFLRGFYDVGHENVLEALFRFKNSKRFFLKTDSFLHSSFDLRLRGEYLNRAALLSSQFLTGRFYYGYLSYRKVFNFSWYSTYFFLNLRRFAPFIRGDFVRLESRETRLLKKKWIFSHFSNNYSLEAALSVGLDIEFLLGGNIPLRLILFQRGKSFHLSLEL